MFRRNVITGVLVLAPIGAALWIVVWFWNMLLGLLALLPNALQPSVFLSEQSPYVHRLVDFLLTIVLFGLLVFSVWFVGLVSSNYFGKKILETISRFFARVPVISTVYSTLEQLLRTFATDSAKNFRRVVQVEYPRKGLFTLAFVTGERRGMLTIYVPTTPNPTSGFYLTVAEAEVKNMNLTVEEALKEIISMGIVYRED